MEKEEQEVILCGTVHIDPQGPERLKKVLDKERPSIITLECTREHLEGYKDFQKAVNQNKLLLKYGARRIKFTPFTQSQISQINKETLMNVFSAIDFELRVAEEYAIKNKIKIICIEKQELINKIAKDFDKDVKKNTHRWFSKIYWESLTLDPKNFSELIDERYKPKPPKENDPTKIIQRNKMAADAIIKLKEKKILHIGGNAHIYGKSPNIYDMLKKEGINVRRLNLFNFNKEAE